MQIWIQGKFWMQIKNQWILAKMEPMDAKIKQSNATEDPIGESMEPLNIKIWDQWM